MLISFVFQNVLYHLVSLCVFCVCRGLGLLQWFIRTNVPWGFCMHDKGRRSTLCFSLDITNFWSVRTPTIWELDTRHSSFFYRLRDYEINMYYITIFKCIIYLEVLHEKMWYIIEGFDFIYGKVSLRVDCDFY